MLNKIFNKKNKPINFLMALSDRELLNWVPDKIYLKMIYKAYTGEKLSFQKPQTFNEKLQWLKLYNRRPEYVDYVDKYAVRSFIEETIGSEYLIPLINVYDNVESINWSELPNKFVLKCTHGSGTNIICKDKSKLNINFEKNRLEKWMKKNWFWVGREWPYKNVKPRIICEEFMVDQGNNRLKDYRLFCFNGQPKFIAVDFDIIDKSKTKRNLYDLDWNLMDSGISYPRELNLKVEKPINLKEMIELSKQLSKNIPHVRVDFFSIENKLYFGEMTFYHQMGLGRFYPEEFNNQAGEWLSL